MSGITSIECIRQRCRIDDETGCWRWAGAMSNRGGGTASVPACWMPELQKTTTVLRAVYLLQGIFVPTRHIIWRNVCWQEDCCNPAHLQAGSRSEYGAALAASGRWKGLPERIASVSKAASSRSKIACSKVRHEILTSDETGAAIAARLGLSKTVVSRLRSGKSFQPTRAASVFAWAAGLGRSHG